VSGQTRVPVLVVIESEAIIDYLQKHSGHEET